MKLENMSKKELIKIVKSQNLQLKELSEFVVKESKNVAKIMIESLLEEKDTEENSRYMVFAEGNNAPSKIHTDQHKAHSEAERVAMQNRNISKGVFVLKIEATYRGTLTVNMERENV